MSVKITYFVHGTTTDNEKDISSGWSDVELSELGKRQAKDLKLRECNYGDYNGKPEKVVEPLQEENIEKRFPNGESYEDVKERIQDFLGFLNEKYGGRSVAIVGHKAPQLALDVLLKGKTWKEAFAQDWRKKKAWQPGWDYILG